MPMIYSGNEVQTVSNANGAISETKNTILFNDVGSSGETTPETPSTPDSISIPKSLSFGHTVYYNPRLDPKNFLEGPLSPNPATRLRQMLARPGIVVS